MTGTMLELKLLQYLLREYSQENARCEWKKRPKSWRKSVSAFANGIGGKSVWGIAGDGFVIIWNCEVKYTLICMMTDLKSSLLEDCWMEVQSRLYRIYESNILNPWGWFCTDIA